MLRKISTINKDGLRADFFIRHGSNDPQIIYEVRISDIYMDTQFEPEDVIIDIGGHIGAFAIDAALRGSGNILVYEPDKVNFTILKGNIRINNLQDKIKAHRLAVSNGNNKLYIDAINFGSHSLIPECVDHKTGKFYEVDTITLGEILENIPKCKLLKLDCEGSEYDILNNGSLVKVENIIAELHIGANDDNLVELLNLRGFETEVINKGRMRKLIAKR